MSRKNVKMNNKKLFEEFEKAIGTKYGHMAEEIIDFFYEFTDFFDYEKIGVDEFNAKHIGPLFDDYLDYEGLSDSECSMLFQMLVDFCDFCQSKKIDYGFFKKYLEKEKDEMYDLWSVYEDDWDDVDLEDFLVDEDPPDITPEDITDNFNSWHDVMKLSLKNKKLDISKILDFLEQTSNYMKTGFTKSLELREKFPDISQKELEYKVGTAIGKKMVNLDDVDAVYKSIFLLPKEQIKKFLNITFLMDENTKYEPGSPERKKAIEEILAELKDLIDDVKRLKGKKNA